MKKLFVVVLALMLAFPTLAGCKKDNAYTRAEAASDIAQKLEFVGGDRTAADIGGSEHGADIEACLARDIFGETPTSGYKFRPGDALTRYELAKVTLYAYAALLCVPCDYLEPGTPRTVTDIGTLGVESQWLVYAALENGFVTLDGTAFRPDAAATKTELTTALDKVAAKANVKAKDLEGYRAQKLKNYHVVPTSKAPLGDKIYRYNAKQANSREERLALSSLQGLVNRDKVQLFADLSTFHWSKLGYQGLEFYTDYAIEKEYFSGYAGEQIQGLENLFTAFKPYLDRVVVYDMDKMFSINTAANIAAVEGRVMVDKNILEIVKRVNPSADIFDTAALNHATQYEAQKWAYEHTFQFLRRDCIAYFLYNEQQDWSRDFSIQMKLPTLWAAGKRSADYDPAGVALVGSILQKFPANIPVLGNQTGYIDGTEQGLGEVEGVLFCGEYGKFTPVWDNIGNLSFLSAIPVAAENKKFDNQEKPVAYQSDKKYISFVMADSGDAPCYFEYGFQYYQWGDTERGTIPYSYTYALGNFDLLPLYTQYITETQTPNDWFYAAVSGLGYMYPLGGFGTKGVLNDNGLYLDSQEMLEDHYIKTGEMCGRMGFNALGIHSFTIGRFWDEYNFADFDEMVAKYTPTIDIFMADIPRLIDSLTKEQLVNQTGYGQTMYHNTTRFSSENLSKEVEGSEEKAVDFLYDEIVNNTKNGGQFYFCGAYSWQYGPHRVKMVIDRLNQNFPGVYEFVNVGQLENLRKASETA